MSEQHNILPTDGSRKHNLSEEQLMAYLDGRLSPAEQHEVEQWLADEGMESDAIEGLRTLPPADTRHSVGRLNHTLRKSLTGRKKKRRHLPADQLTWVAIVVILLLAAVAYIVIRKSIR